jgi:hypothetical protein
VLLPVLLWKVDPGKYFFRNGKDVKIVSFAFAATVGSESVILGARILFQFLKPPTLFGQGNLLS